MRKIVLILILGLFSGVFAQEEKLDLNTAKLEELQKLPIAAELVNEIYNYITYKKFLTSIYEIRSLKGMTQEQFDTLKSLVRVEPAVEKDDYTRRLIELQYLIERYSNDDGARQDDEYVDRLLRPVSLKKVRYSDLNGLSGVTPIDAASIITFIKNDGKINSERDLRGIDGLSHFGYTNSKSFLDYNERVDDRFHFSYRMKLSNLPSLGTEDQTTIGASLNNSLDRPNVLHKIRFSKENIKSGIAYQRRFNEDEGFSDGPTLKWYHGYENIGNKDFELKKIYFGNYHVSWGQGLVMENTDTFSSRSSGFGFQKRVDGVIGDLSDTEEFAFRGIAFEAYVKNFRLLGFASLDKKDAILDQKPGENDWDAYFVSNFRRDINFVDDNGILVSDSLVMKKDFVKEFTFGGQLRYEFAPGINLGASFYESQYNKELSPRIENLIRTTELDGVETIDNEIKNRYASRNANTVFGKDTAYRRVVGTDFQIVRENVSLQGEVASLLDYNTTIGIETDSTKNLSFADSPKAIVLSGYVQYENFDFLALYRNYDRRFDNPYNRGFANYAANKGTVVEDDYRDLSPDFVLLQENSYAPQHEEGMFFASRFQASRRVTLSLNYDVWSRKPDNADNYRFVTTVELRPTFNFRLRYRNKFQSRDFTNAFSKNGFDNIENIFTARMLLSKRNTLELGYFLSSVKFRVRPRLSNTVLTDEKGGGPSIFGDAGDNSEVISFAFNHNYSERLELKLWAGIYRGFFWSFEDTHFGVFDGNGIRYRALVTSYLTPNIALKLHYIVDQQLEIRNHEARTYNATQPEGASSTGPDYFGDRINKSPDNVFFIQFDYNF
ncbi:helix-hairpin-helix domain-containing protein [bacterium]|nr:helix-hairpin-helix domain-containing protein [bacterium]